MNKKVEVKNEGSFTLSLLTILFIGLKLTGFINWSWWWVLSPTLIPIGLVLLVLIIAGVNFLISE